MCDQSSSHSEFISRQNGSGSAPGPLWVLMPRGGKQCGFAWQSMDTACYYAPTELGCFLRPTPAAGSLAREGSGLELGKCLLVHRACKGSQ